MIISLPEIMPYPYPYRRCLYCLMVIVLVLVLLIAGCRDEEVENDKNTPLLSRCKDCHEVILDEFHSFSCVACHQGIDGADSIDTGHQGLIAQPAHPENAKTYCDPCHGDKLKIANNSSHYTLTNHINKIRDRFTPGNTETTPSGIYASAAPASQAQLVDDLLRRRCLRCHVYFKGDKFPLTQRATGCGACHLDYYDGELKSHTFMKHPDDQRCLSCHYGNHVGFDYYGRFEHDLNEEYRTPYTTTEDFFRPYGVEYHQLTPDVHQIAGMICIDCHSMDQIMSSSDTGTSCTSCHNQTDLQNNEHPAIKHDDGQYLFTSRATTKQFVLPVMSHPAHTKYNKFMSCQVCHAQWSFNDDQTHLMRIDHDDFDQFDKLTLDGSFEINHILASHLEYDGEWLEPVMNDKFTLETYPGIWFKGFRQRRWENMAVSFDLHGILQVTRPLLDLHLTWIDEDEIVRFDNIGTNNDESTEIHYKPHTIGKAGPFYEQRFNHLLHNNAVVTPE